MQPSAIEYFTDYSITKPKLDLRMLLLINAFSSTLVLMSYNSETAVAAFIVSAIALIIFAMYKQLAIYFVLFVVATFFVEAMPYFDKANKLMLFMRLFGIMIFFVGKLLPFFMLAHVVLKKISVNYLVSSLRKLHFPRGILLSLVVALRYLPTAKQEFDLIKQAMRLKGIDLSFKNFFRSPLKMIEYTFVPLLFRSVLVAEQMSAAAVVKGIEYEGKQSSLLPIKMQFIDYIYAIFSLALIFYSYFGFWDLAQICAPFLQKIFI